MSIRRRRPTPLPLLAVTLAAFAAVLCCTTSLGLFAAQRLGAVNSAAAEIREGYLPSTRILGEIAYHTMRFRQLEATSALAADAEARTKEEAAMRKVEEKGERAFASYEPLGHAGEGRRLDDDMKRAWASYLDLDTKFLTLSRAQDGHDAVSAYRGEMRTVFNRFQDVLQADIALHVKQSGLAADRGAAG